MKKWEYKHEIFSAGSPDFKQLNQLGQNGWELCGITKIDFPNNNNQVYIFKKPL